MNSISFYKALLLEGLDEKKLSKKQMDIASAAEPEDEITPADFRALQAKKKSMKKEGEDSRKFEVDDIVKVKATGKKGKVVDMSPSETFFIVNIQGKNSSYHESDLELVKRPSLNESQDHEVSMAHNSLKSIVSSASQLMNMLGQDEKDIPAWIQDHITNAENYINQASKNYHEYHNNEDSMDELPVDNEEEPVDDMTLQSMMEDLFEAKKKPSAGLSKKQKSAIVKKAQSGKDMGKKGKGFEKIVKAAKKSGADNPEAVAGAAFWKSQAKKAK